MHLSDDFTTSSILAASLGGGLLGALAGLRLEGQAKTLPSASLAAPLVTGGVVLTGLVASAFVDPSFFEAANVASLSYPRLVLSAAMVGVGATWGQGCTCGNGIQGLSGLSPTSLAFVALFMGTAVATAGLFSSGDLLVVGEAAAAGGLGGGEQGVGFAVLVFAAATGIAVQAAKAPAAVADGLAGVSFAAALLLSGMARPSKVIGFLDVGGARGWDPSLMFVMAGAIAVCTPIYWRGGHHHRDQPISAWFRRPLDAAHVLGALLFGGGWGLSGLCPGPVLVNCGLLVPKACLFAAVMFGARPLAAWLKPILFAAPPASSKQRR